MSEPRYIKPDTLSLHAGQRPDAEHGARAVPIYQTTSYVFRDTDHAAALFNLERAGYLYSRISNPTTAVLEERIAALEGGVGAVCTASGQAALMLAVMTLMDAGSHIVSSQSIYGGSHNLFMHTLPRFGIDTTFVDPRDPAAFKAAIRPNTRLLFGETLGNPTPDVPRDQIVDYMVDHNQWIVGTPDDCIAGIERLQEITGGFGKFMIRVEDWAPRDKILRSYELLARYVMPQFQGSLVGIETSRQWAAQIKDDLQVNRRAGLQAAADSYTKQRS